MKKPKMPAFTAPQQPARTVAKLQALSLLFAIVIIGSVSYSPAPKPEPIAKTDDRGRVEKVVDWGGKWAKKLAPIAAVL